MNVFQTMLSRSKSRAIDSDHLPQLNAFVDVAIGGKTECVPVEAMGRTSFQVRRPARAAVGEKALFNYLNSCGGFRFVAECTAVSECLATFALPSEIVVIKQFANKRRNYRFKHALSVMWRYAPDGVGYGEFTKSTTADISSAGLSLVVPRELRLGTQIEVKLDLEGFTKCFATVGTLTRPTQKQCSGKFIAGLALTNLTATNANAIGEFISARQSGQRKRGLADDH